MMKNFDYDYKIKFSAESVNIKDQSKVEELLHEADELAQDPEKNEKVTVQFRTLKKKDDKWEILDVSTILIDLKNPIVVSGKLIKEWIKSYQEYLANSISDKDVEIEMVKVYYPLDKTNKTENIPEVGNFVQYFKVDTEIREESYVIMDYTKGMPGKNLGYSIVSVKNKMGELKGNLLKNDTEIKVQPAKNKIK